MVSGAEGRLGSTYNGRLSTVLFIGGLSDLGTGRTTDQFTVANFSADGAVGYYGYDTTLFNDLNGYYFDFSSADGGGAYSALFYGGRYADVLIGGEGADTLNGGGGADSLVGGEGADAFYVDNIGDVVTENADEGTDTIHSSIAWRLGANVENLTLTGSDRINGVGNALDNVLTGNDGANYLKGGNGDDTLNGGGGNDRLNGGLGADSLAGGTGDDAYYVDDLGDSVTEDADGGSDTVYASVDYALSANTERLIGSGATGLALTGNDLANRIIGTAGNDTLTGGAGKDALTGGDGEDVFVFTGVADASDSITDFKVGVDTIAIDLAGFGLTSFDDSLFESNATGKATEADTRFVYNETLGRLFYDADGTGSEKAVLVATLRGAPELTADSFSIIGTEA